MSARVLSPAMDLTRELNLLASSSSSSSSCTSSSLAGTKELGAKRNARRNLFGPPDPRSVQFAREKVEEIKAGSQKYWNFDFERELPLEGRYKWERVGTGEVPTAYACQRLPLLGSSAVATPIKPSTSSSSCTTTRTSADNYYYIPTSTTCNSQFAREPLLSVSARIITRSQSSTTTASSSSSVSTGPQAGTSVAISQYSSSSGDEISSQRRSTSGHLSQAASLPLSTPAKGIFAVPSIPSVSSSSSSSTSSSSASASSTSSSKSDDVKCKVQVKSTKQTKMSDYCKVRKRRAEPETVPSIVEKKAAL